MKHVLGVLGVLAAGVLLAVSAAMNWRFGFQLGRTEMDGQIYGAASAAADCFKALVPFFFFAAWKNRMWSQAAASAVVWVVVTAYSFTSAVGHATLNRVDSTGERAAQAQLYKDLRADQKRIEDEMGWIPQHRPAQTVQADIDNAKNQRPWSWTDGCTNVKGKDGRSFCEKYHGWMAEKAAADQATVLEVRKADVQAKLARMSGDGSMMGAADPQAAMLAKLGSAFFPNLKVDDVQTALALFIALLLEIGSGFGMYVAFSQWRLYDRAAPAAPSMVSLATSTPVAVAPVVQAALPQPKQRVASANDNSSKETVKEVKPETKLVAAAPAPAVVQRLVAPETDVERFYKERIETQDGSSLTATSLYEDYCAWCEEREKEPLALPTFGREFGELGVQKARIAGRVRYIGIALKSAMEGEEDKKPPVFATQAA